MSLMSHAPKTFLRVLHAHLYSKCEELSGEPQFGFKKGLETREVLFSMKILLQRACDYRKDIFVCFIDYRKHSLLFSFVTERVSLYR